MHSNSRASIWLTRSACAVATLFALALSFLQARTRLGSTQFDDAFMFIRYARHWLEGGGFSWNLVDGPAYGITSPLHLFIVTALRGATRLPDALLLTGSSYAFGLLACAALTLLGFRLAGPALRASWAPVLIVPCLLFTEPFVEMQFTGMETTLALFTNALLALAAVAWAKKPGAFRLTAVLAAALLTIMARPDNGPYAFLVPALLLLASERGAWKQALRYALLLGALLVVDRIAMRFLFGDFLPLPLYAKSAGFYEGYVGIRQWNALFELLTFLRQALPFLLVIVLAATRPSRARLLAVLVPVALTFAYLLTVTMIMGSNARYYFPSLAFLVLAAGIALENFGRPALRPLALAAAALLAAFTSPVAQRYSAAAWEAAFMPLPPRAEAQTRYGVPAAEPLPERDWWTTLEAMADLGSGLPEGTVLAASEHGLLGARAPALTLLDLVGLHDRETAHHGFSADRVFARRPDVIWFPHDHYTRIVADLIDHPDFFAQYDFYPNAYLYGLALRNDSPRAARVRELVGAHFARTYPGKKLQDYRAVLQP